MPIDPTPRAALYYRDPSGKEPAREFIRSLKDPIGRQKINVKIRKAEKGNFGVEGTGYRHLRGRLWELKVSYGPGYRVYFALHGEEIIILLTAGDKTTQDSDIEKAEKYLKNFQSQGE